jgi:hypothetical protein
MLPIPLYPNFTFVLHFSGQCLSGEAISGTLWAIATEIDPNKAAKALVRGW